MADPFLLPLESSVELRLVGGKAAGLRKFAGCGFSVPRGCARLRLYEHCLSVAGIDTAVEVEDHGGAQVNEQQNGRAFSSA